MLNGKTTEVELPMQERNRAARDEPQRVDDLRFDASARLKLTSARLPFLPQTPAHFIAALRNLAGPAIPN